jgi:pimeloyl-ACP methyl ester carboxylesterase
MISWDEQFCALLASQGYRVIRFDNRDVGMATKFNGMAVPDIGQLLQARVSGTINEFKVPYSLYDMAADTLALMDELDVEKAHIIGASMGGGIAQLLAIEHPERMLTLTAMMTSSGCPTLPLPKPEAIAVFTRPESPNREAYINSVIAGWHVMYGSGYPMDEEDARTRAEYYYDRAYYPEGSARQLAATAVMESLKPKLAEVTVPTLVIHGDEDPLFPIECGRDIAVSVPGAKMIVLEGVGHSLPKPTWAHVIAALDAFFRDHPG